MVLEKTVAGPARNPDFPTCATSSECTPSWVMPGHEVSWLMGMRSLACWRAAEPVPA